jgi:hypothetical protein
MNQAKVGRPPHFSAQLTSHPRSPLLLHPRARVVVWVTDWRVRAGRRSLSDHAPSLACGAPLSGAHFPPLLSLFMFFSPLVSRSRSRRCRIYRSRCSAPGNPAPINNGVFPARA